MKSDKRKGVKQKRKITRSYYTGRQFKKHVISFIRAIVDLYLQKPLNWLPTNWAPISLASQNLCTGAAHALHNEQKKKKTESDNQL